MFLVSAELSFEGIDRDRLAGASIDVPRQGTCWNARALSVEGWAVGRESPVTSVEIVSETGRLRRMRLSVERPDVVAHLSGMNGTMYSGFRGAIDVTGLSSDKLDVQAILRSGVTARIGSLHLRRFWHAGSHPAEHDVVSIVIVCFNQAHFVAEAIESARRQTYDKLEVIVIDDGSDDNTGEVVARHSGVRYIRQNNQGLAAARNTGISRSNGEFIIFLDADDRLRPNAASIAIEHLRAHPECAFVSGEYCDIGVDGKIVGQWERPTIDREHYLALLKSNYIACHAAVAYRRSVFQVVEGFDSRLNPCEDYDLYLRISRSFPICSHGELVAEYRRYGAGMSDDPARMLVAALRALEAQRPFIGKDRRRALAFAEGLRHWRARYGEPLAAVVRQQLGRRETRLQGLRGLVQLLRRAPGKLPRIVRAIR